MFQGPELNAIKQVVRVGWICLISDDEGIQGISLKYKLHKNPHDFNHQTVQDYLHSFFDILTDAVVKVHTMPIHSYEQLQKEWRFGLAEDFLDREGQPYSYAEDGSQRWGDEVHKMPYPPGNDENTGRSRVIALSHDGKYLAVSSKCDIMVYNTTSYTLDYHLKGHIQEVEAMAFRPENSSQLVSSASSRPVGSNSDSLILIWDLDTYRAEPLLDPNNTSRISLAAVKSAITEIQTLSSPTMSITSNDEASLATSFETHITSLITAKLTNTHLKSIKGSIQRSCGSKPFSPSGHALIYLSPGKRRSNDHDESWQLKVYSLDQHQDMYTLSGHTDHIMWTGFNDDETLIGTCSWDKSIRIWNATDGHGSQKYKFTTEGQNWAGGFSPNGKYFVSTCGKGTLHVYNLHDGSEYMQLDMGKGHWCRTVAWHPSSAWFAVGGRSQGSLYQIDVQTRTILQRRRLEDPTAKDGVVTRMHFNLEVLALDIVDGGRKLVFMISTDGSAEVYDVEKECKWRFARAGTMGELESNGSSITTGSNKPGTSIKVWEDWKLGLVRIATCDGDAIRFWAVPLTQAVK